MAPPRGLHTLARLHGVQTAYHDNDGRRQAASPDVLMEVLRALRVPVRGGADIRRLLEQRRRELWDRVLEPVVVAWVRAGRAGDGGREGGRGRDQPRDPIKHGGPDNRFLLRLPVRLRDRPVHVAVNLEDGELRRWSVEAASLPVREEVEVDGVGYVALEVELPTLRAGYHDLHVALGPAGRDGRFSALLIAAPRRAPGWEQVVGERAWGLFAPLYALWEEAGGTTAAEAVAPGFHLLDRLAGLIAERGGSILGTLPLLAAFLDEPYEPSPYAPVSRLFWNELYVEPPAGAEWKTATPYRDGLFDPRAAMAAKRPALAAAARAFFAEGGHEPEELLAFRARNPRADDYARYRALVARHGRWPGWQDRLRGRDVRPTDYDADVAHYHLYVQWLAERQLTAASERAVSRGVGLYLDLPLGVHPDGYDVWRERELFALEASAGAPPDSLAAGGQDWGFPPLHPEAGRLDGHRYFVSCIRKHLRFSRVLRIDHVMQLHRMYWVVGTDATEGVYVRSPAEELFAVLCLESCRAGAVIVGEDLGTVPRSIRTGMRRHGMPGMYVGQFELTDVDGGASLEPRPVRPGTLAAIGTHDTPTFAGWWWGRDVEIRHELDQMSDDEAAAELAGRAEMRRKLASGLGVDRTTGAAGGATAAVAGGKDGDDRARAGEVHAALMRRMGGSDAGLVLATMEDLWLETEPQNVPGTLREENWRRQSSRPVEALGQPAVAAQLDELNQSREGTV
jgi:4-alpha-glucanotransferase